MKFSTLWQRFGKAITSTLFAVGITAYQVYGGDNRVDLVEAFIVVLAFGNALNTFVVPLTPEYPQAKTWASAVITGATIATTLFVDGYQGDDLFIIGAAVLQTLGVKVAPAVSNNGVGSRQ